MALTFLLTVFEDKALADQAVVAVEKAVHHEDMTPASVPSKRTENVDMVETVSRDDNPPPSKV